MPYHEAIGALKYLATSTRPGLAFPVGCLSRFVQHPNVLHAGAVKIVVLRDVAATHNHGVFSSNGTTASEGPIEINGLVDTDWGNCPETRKKAYRGT